MVLLVQGSSGWSGALGYLDKHHATGIPTKPWGNPNAYGHALQWARFAPLGPCSAGMKGTGSAGPTIDLCKPGGATRFRLDEKMPG